MSTLWDTPAPDLARWPPRACEGADTRLFFAEGLGHLTTATRAKAICRRCPAVRACAEYAIPLAPLHGIWGAMSAAERAEIRSQQQKEA